MPAADTFDSFLLYAGLLPGDPESSPPMSLLLKPAFTPILTPIRSDFGLGGWLSVEVYCLCMPIFRIDRGSPSSRCARLASDA